MSSSHDHRPGAQPHDGGRSSRLLRLLAPLRGDEHVLDAGCGRGGLLGALAGYVATLTGVDRDEAALALARRTAPANATYLAGDVTALPFDAGAFDISGTAGVLHHVHRPDLVVLELARVTRAGGLVVVVDRVGGADAAASREVDARWRERHPSHHHFLADAEIRQLLAAAGLVPGAVELTSESSGEGPVDFGWYVARRPEPVSPRRTGPRT